MPRLGMLIDLKRCAGCNACTMACKAENGTPPGVFGGRVLEKEIGKYPTAKREFIPVLCNQCKDASCVEVCPSSATTKREDGIVVIDDNKCTGCRTCYVSCPYNNRFFLSRGSLKKGYYGDYLTPFENVKYAKMQEGTVIKCNFCVHRIDQGLEPACVVNCPTEARVFGDIDDPTSKVSKLIRQRGGFQLLPEANTDPSVFYVR